MSDYAQQVGARLRELVDAAGGTAEFAKKLGISPAQVSIYLGGKRLIGNKMRARLVEAGYDDYWVMYGDKQDIDRKYDTSIERQWRERFREKAEMLDMLRENGIESAAQLRDVLGLYRMAAKTTLAVNEKKKQYGRKK